MNSRNIAILSLAVALSLVAYRPGTAASPSVGQKIATSTGDTKAAPAWELKDLEGKPVKLSDFKGKVVLLTFWATWCPPCRTEIPDLIAMQNQYRDQGLVVVGISLDQTGAATVKSFATRMKINYPIVMGDEKTAEAYGNVEAIPSTFYIDREGNVAGVHTGGTDKATFEDAVKPLLAKSAANL